VLQRNKTRGAKSSGVASRGDENQPNGGRQQKQLDERHVPRSEPQVKVVHREKKPSITSREKPDYHQKQIDSAGKSL
jgi:hypothetical protein